MPNTNQDWGANIKYNTTGPGWVLTVANIATIIRVGNQDRCRNQDFAGWRIMGLDAAIPAIMVIQ
jgi:hypothetical protein